MASLAADEDKEEVVTKNEEENSASQQESAKRKKKNKKKKKKKKKKNDAAKEEEGEETAEANAANAAGESDGKAQLTEKEKLLKALYGNRYKRRNAGELSDAAHKFWDTQPVPKLKEKMEDAENGPIDEPKTPDDVRATPLNLPKGFKWVSVDVHSDEESMEVYKLLSRNYVEDDDEMFRFDYSKEFLQWALLSPGFHKDWHVGVRRESNNKLMAFITGIPVEQVVHGKTVIMAEINFLCVHKKLRKHRLAPVLIQEITRRVNRLNIWQAVYTAGIVLPKPVAACKYWHRTINTRKLVEVKFTRLGHNQTMKRMQRLHSLPATTSTPGLREMTPADVPAARELLMKYLGNFKLHPVFRDDEEFAHWMLPRKGVVNSFVAETNGVITDMISFYFLNSSVIKNPKHSTLFAVYSFYNVAQTVSLTELMRDALILAKNNGADVFNCLDLMDNGQIFSELKFGIGDGNLQYYVYNWACPEIKSEEVGLHLPIGPQM
eukprot:g2788.t1